MANTVRRYIIAVTLQHLYNWIKHRFSAVTCGRPMNAPTDSLQNKNASEPYRASDAFYLSDCLLKLRAVVHHQP